MKRLLAFALSFGSLGASIACAQDLSSPPRYTEYRADAIIGRGTALEGGLGLVVPFGAYVRMGLDGAAGESWRAGAAHLSSRIDAIGRFLLDPYRETPLAVSLGGGVSVPYVDGERVRPYLALVVDIEGRMHRGLTPAVQIGLGGGARIGVVLRTSTVRWR